MRWTDFGSGSGLKFFFKFAVPRNTLVSDGLWPPGNFRREGVMWFLSFFRRPRVPESGGARPDVPEVDEPAGVKLDSSRAAKAKVVLVCEADDTNRRLFVDLLAAAGYRPLAAVDVDQALALARSCRPDLMTVEIKPPQLVNEATIEELRAEPALRDTPIIAVTACAMYGDRERLLEIGCDGYIAKPISVRPYLDAIAEFLSPHRIAAE